MKRRDKKNRRDSRAAGKAMLCLLLSALLAGSLPARAFSGGQTEAEAESGYSESDAEILTEERSAEGTVPEESVPGESVEEEETQETSEPAAEEETVVETGTDEADAEESLTETAVEEETPAGEPEEEPAAEVPASEEPVTEETAIEEAPAGEASTEELTPAEDPAEEPPAEEPSAAEEKPSAEEMPNEEAATEEQTAEEATTEETPAEEPTVEEGTTEEAAPEESSAEENPTEEELTTEDPAAEGRPAEEATTEEPVPEEATAEESTVEEPATEEPVTEEAPTEEPAAEEPAAEEATTEEAATEEPPAEEPSVEEPATEEMTSEETTTEEATPEEESTESSVSEETTEAPTVSGELSGELVTGPLEETAEETTSGPTEEEILEQQAEPLMDEESPEETAAESAAESSAETIPQDVKERPQTEKNASDQPAEPVQETEENSAKPSSEAVQTTEENHSEVSAEPVPESSAASPEKPQSPPAESGSGTGDVPETAAHSSGTQDPAGSAADREELPVTETSPEMHPAGTRPVEKSPAEGYPSESIPEDETAATDPMGGGTESTEVPEETSAEQKAAPTITFTAAPAGGDGIYHRDIPVGIHVEQKEGGSKKQRITYRIREAEGGKILQEGILHEEEQTGDTGGNPEWRGALLVSSEETEGKVELEVDVTDETGTQTSQAIAFELDTRAPRIYVEYDNNDVRNGWYFRQPRTARITVEDENFEENLVDIAMEVVTENGPGHEPLLLWTHRGNRHTVQIFCGEDGAYSLAVSAADTAGNFSSTMITGSAAPASFTIDTDGENLLQIDGLEDGMPEERPEISAWNGEAIRMFFDDRNFGGYRIQLFRSRVREEASAASGIFVEENADVTARFLQTSSGSTPGTVVLRIPETEEDGACSDGLYRLEISAWDLAGNQTDESLSFLVNRAGSVYVFEPSFCGVSGDGSVCIPKVDGPLVLKEYTLRPLSWAEGLVSRDTGGEETVLASEEVLATEEAALGGAWYCYSYCFQPEYFSRDGIYRLRVESSGDVRSAEEENGGFVFLFRLDATPPELTSVTGLEKERAGREKEVTFEAFDAMGLASVEAFVDGRSVLREDAPSDLNRYQGSFLLEEGADHRIRVILTDLAGNVLDTDARDRDGEYLFRPAYPFTRQISIRRAGFLMGGPVLQNRRQKMLFLLVLGVLLFVTVFFERQLITLLRKKIRWKKGLTFQKRSRKI